MEEKHRPRTFCVFVYADARPTVQPTKGKRAGALKDTGRALNGAVSHELQYQNDQQNYHEHSYD